MICPRCRAENEMLFSALSQSFICDNQNCGFELELDPQDLEVLLQPQEELTLA